LVSDFRMLNAKLKQSPYPLPRIDDTLQQLEGFQYATALDINMGYYHIQLSTEAQEMRTIVTEFGKYQYLRLPMGVVCAPDIFQSKINELLGDIEAVRAYINDILVVTKGSFEDHMETLDRVLTRCNLANLKVNASKPFWGRSEVEYLGYIISREGIKPQRKKIEAILNIATPKTTTDVRRLVGMVQYYRDMWRSRSHIMAPLTELSKGKKGQPIKWMQEHEDAFQAIKKVITQDTMLTYPDWSKPFIVHTDASDKQIGAVISQNNKPIAFFSRKFNKAQLNYTTTEKELLAIVKCLKHCRNILFGYEIIVYLDHKNLVPAATLSESQRVMR
jgi:hypothetical protein